MDNQPREKDSFVNAQKEGYFDFTEMSKEQDSLVINGTSVGKSPDTIQRSEKYKENFEKMGNGIENIKVIKNFLSDRECQMIIGITKRMGDLEEFPVQWDSDFKPTVTRKSYSNLSLPYQYVEKVQQLLEKEYGFKVRNKTAFIAKWDEGDVLHLHVDDLGPTNTNHMATLIYLNDDYEGGEIEFPTHNLSHAPQTGDLIMFPGNMHYAHEVKTITSGSRWTLPMWFEFE